MLEACFLLFRVEAERPSEHKVVIAHPRLFATDVGFAAWAARNTHEVDLVLVHPGGRLVAVEVKASTSVGPADAQGLARFAASEPERLVRGIVVYEGSRVLTLSAPGDHQILAVPRSLL